MDEGSPAGVSGDTATDPAELAAIAEGLLAGWDSTAHGEAEFRQRGRRPSAVRFAAIHGLCAHTHECSRLVLSAHHQGLHLAALPVVRAAYESAITAMWLAQMESSEGAFIADDAKQRRGAAESLRKLGDHAHLRAAEEMLAELEAIPNPFGSSAWSFERRAESLEGGAMAYLIYRVLSKFSHAGLGVVDSFYVETGEPPGIALRDVPEAIQPKLYLFLTGASLVWAGSARSYLDHSRGRRSELRRAATRLGVSPNLQLTAKAAKQDQIAVREARRGRPSIPDR